MQCGPYLVAGVAVLARGASRDPSAAEICSVLRQARQGDVGSAREGCCPFAGVLDSRHLALATRLSEYCDPCLRHYPRLQSRNRHRRKPLLRCAMRLHPARSSTQAEAEGGRHALAGPCETQLRAGTAGVLGRRYMTRVIARLGDLEGPRISRRRHLRHQIARRLSDRLPARLAAR